MQSTTPVANAGTIKNPLRPIGVTVVLKASVINSKNATLYGPVLYETVVFPEIGLLTEGTHAQVRERVFQLARINFTFSKWEEYGKNGDWCVRALLLRRDILTPVQIREVFALRRKLWSK